MYSQTAQAQFLYINANRQTLIHINTYILKISPDSICVILLVENITSKLTGSQSTVALLLLATLATLLVVTVLRPEDVIQHIATCAYVNVLAGIRSD